MHKRNRGVILRTIEQHINFKDLELGLFAHPTQEPLLQINWQDMALGEFLRNYISTPRSVDFVSRSSIREDVAIAELSGLLLSHKDDTITVLDACCGAGTLATRILKSMGDEVGRVRYFAIDEQPSSIKAINSQLHDFDRFSSFKPIQRHVCDLHDLPRGSIDLIVLNNALHESPPRFFPAMFSVFNSLLNPSRGMVQIVDLESLPEDHPESIAITWKAPEVEDFLAAAGLPAIVTRHPKVTMAFQAQVKHNLGGVHESQMLKSLQTSLNLKLSAAVISRRGIDANASSQFVQLEEWLVATGTIARCAEELDIIVNRTEPLIT